jgi:hypothetical protein
VDEAALEGPTNPTLSWTVVVPSLELYDSGSCTDTAKWGEGFDFSVDRTAEFGLEVQPVFERFIGFAANVTGILQQVEEQVRSAWGTRPLRPRESEGDDEAKDAAGSGGGDSAAGLHAAALMGTVYGGAGRSGSGGASSGSAGSSSAGTSAGAGAAREADVARALARTDVSPFVLPTRVPLRPRPEATGAAAAEGERRTRRLNGLNTYGGFYGWDCWTCTLRPGRDGYGLGTNGFYVTSKYFPAFGNYNWGYLGLGRNWGFGGNDIGPGYLGGGGGYAGGWGDGGWGGGYGGGLFGILGGSSYLNRFNDYGGTGGQGAWLPNQGRRSSIDGWGWTYRYARRRLAAASEGAAPATAAAAAAAAAPMTAGVAAAGTVQAAGVVAAVLRAAADAGAAMRPVCVAPAATCAAVAAAPGRCPPGAEPRADLSARAVAHGVVAPAAAGGLGFAAPSLAVTANGTMLVAATYSGAGRIRGSAAPAYPGGPRPPMWGGLRGAAAAAAAGESVGAPGGSRDPALAARSSKPSRGRPRPPTHRRRDARDPAVRRRRARAAPRAAGPRRARARGGAPAGRVARAARARAAPRQRRRLPYRGAAAQRVGRRVGLGRRRVSGDAWRRRALCARRRGAPPCADLHTDPFGLPSFPMAWLSPSSGPPWWTGPSGRSTGRSRTPACTCKPGTRVHCHGEARRRRHSTTAPRRLRSRRTTHPGGARAAPRRAAPRRAPISAAPPAAATNVPPRCPTVSTRCASASRPAL